MVLLGPRIHFYEINDQSWFPSYFREKVQAGLTMLWSLNLPFIQTSPPAALVAKTLQNSLGKRVSIYTYVDFCAGAGGPTPFIEQDLNKRLQEHQLNVTTNGITSTPAGVDFVLTDIAPHISAWTLAAKKSDHLHYIPEPVDAANAPRDLLASFSFSRKSSTSDSRKVFRLFNLAFHHFDDPLATQILRNSIATADGFGIFELQARTFSSLLTVTLMWPLLLLVSPFYFWRSPGHMFFTYIIPIIPFVLVFDGWISSFRTRSAGEVLELLGREAERMEDWEFASGSECHTWPIGEMSWFVGVKEGAEN